MKIDIPEFAIIGHPNEGKSSVVSTLAEDDTVPVSRIPGETTTSRVYPVRIDGKEIIRFIDTPGFQNPGKTLEWLRAFSGPSHTMLHAFYETHIPLAKFRDECELFKPLLDRGGIIYVVDGSRPMRRVDKMEMEILRLTGRPRMAIINCKDDALHYLKDWKNEFHRHFNMTRTFNAHKATYSERIALLESLKSIDQDWEEALNLVVTSFKKDWANRGSLTVSAICALLKECTGYTAHKTSPSKDKIPEIREQLLKTFQNHLKTAETQCHQQIRRLFKHNIFNYTLPDQSILHEDLFDRSTWHILGLKPKELAAAAAVTGGGLGAAIDLVTGGLSLGIFTAIGGALAAGYVLWEGERLAKIRVKRIGLGGYKVHMGPVENVQLLYIMLDRALLYYMHATNWAHALRDMPNWNEVEPPESKKGFSSTWDKKKRGICNAYFAALRQNKEFHQPERAFREMLEKELVFISEREGRQETVPIKTK